MESEEPLAGMLTADLVAGGDPNAPTVNVTGALVEAPFAMARVDTLQVVAEYHDGQVAFRKLDLLSEFGLLRATGTVANPGAAIDEFWPGAALDLRLDFVEADWAILDQFALLDDNDILASAKVWCNNSDRVLSMLADGLVNRKLFSVEMNNEPFQSGRVSEIRRKVTDRLSISNEEAEYLVISDSISNYAYSDMDDRISIMDKNGNTRDIAEASDILNISVLSKTVRKYFLCYPRFLKEK